MEIKKAGEGAVRSGANECRMRFSRKRKRRGEKEGYKEQSDKSCRVAALRNIYWLMERKLRLTLLKLSWKNPHLVLICMIIHFKLFNHWGKDSPFINTCLHYSLFMYPTQSPNPNLSISKLFFLCNHKIPVRKMEFVVVTFLMLWLIGQASIGQIYGDNCIIY